MLNSKLNSLSVMYIQIIKFDSWVPYGASVTRYFSRQLLNKHAKITKIEKKLLDFFVNQSGLKISKTYYSKIYTFKYYSIIYKYSKPESFGIATLKIPATMPTHFDNAACTFFHLYLGFWLWSFFFLYFLRLSGFQKCHPRRFPSFKLWFFHVFHFSLPVFIDSAV